MKDASRMLAWLERTLFVVGIAAIGWIVCAIGDAWMAQRSGWRWLELNGGLRPSATGASRPGTVARGSPLAELTIPRIGLSAVVLEGADDRSLSLGPGHVEGTAAPGERGNLAIAGHRDTFFRPLRNVRVGDDVTLRVPGRRFHYRVSRLWVVGPSDVSVLAPTERSSLTLITCYPFSVLGPAPRRFIVRARLVGELPVRGVGLQPDSHVPSGFSGTRT